eukprot:CAMPEP_0172654904 /NCGR_PEP_ID=MMETSP1074-20121228/247_1 /TAXON_ID=2916 /ORGANISM="Ceratium fusus, Strain PA161109" /LENGTH=52 /DNA_ID=CAMNT_0013469407 /DNA_START=46 /DNA_END=201 /DNA_ORIENTATION=-
MALPALFIAVPSGKYPTSFKYLDVGNGDPFVCRSAVSGRKIALPAFGNDVPS